MLEINRLSFPGLGIGPFSVNNVAFTVNLFGTEFDIAWYAIIITLGMICAVLYTIFRAKQIGVTVDDIIDYVIFVIPIGVLGARLYYVIMEIDNYKTLADVFAFRDGGLAIYGGIIAGTATVYVVSLVKKISFPALGDCIVPGLILAQAIGRWGNFMNAEAYGSESTSFIRMGIEQFSGEFIYVHPTFLYESLWNIIGFIAINIFFKHKKYDGQNILLVFGWYGLGRMLIEGLRTDSLYLWGTDIRVSQALAAVVLIGCVAALIYFAIKPPKKELYFKPTPEKKKDEK